MSKKSCKHCGESFTLLPGKPGYSNECPECLHEKTRPHVPADVVATFLKHYPKQRRYLDAARNNFLKLGIDAATVDDFIAAVIARSPARQT
jgi:hypothetical protein